MREFDKKYGTSVALRVAEIVLRDRGGRYQSGFRADAQHRRTGGADQHHCGGTEEIHLGQDPCQLPGGLHRYPVDRHRLLCLGRYHGAVVVGFAVAYAAMFGFDKLREALQKIKG